MRVGVCVCAFLLCVRVFVGLCLFVLLSKSDELATVFFFQITFFLTFLNVHLLVANFIYCSFSLSVCLPTYFVLMSHVFKTSNMEPYYSLHICTLSLIPSLYAANLYLWSHV